MPGDTRQATTRASRRRQLLAGLALLSCAAIYAAGSTGDPLTGLLSISGGLLWFAACFLLRRAVKDAADLPDDQLDEREIVLRNRSCLESYRLLGGALAVSLLLALAQDVVDGQLVRSWHHLLAAVLLLSAVLPSVVLARLDPSRHDADDEQATVQCWS